MKLKNTWGIKKTETGKGITQLISCKFSEQYINEAVKRLNKLDKKGVKYYITKNMNAK